MDKPTTLYFPDTLPDVATTARLLLFFESIHYYQPAETSGLGRDQLEPRLNLLRERGCCQGLVPVPLGRDAARFNRLLKDIGNRCADFDKQALAALASLAATTGDRDEVAPGGLVAALRHAPDLQKENRPAKTGDQPSLWQARLVLQLAELLDQEEREISAKLAAIAARRREMFIALRGEGPAAPAYQAVPPPRLTPRLLNQRMQAWISFFLAAQNKPATADGCWLLTTADPAAAAFVLDRYEARRRQAAVTLATLPLPRAEDLGWPPAEADEAAISTYLDRRRRFRQKISRPLAHFMGRLTEIAAGAKKSPRPGPVAPDARQSALDEAWAAALQEDFPARPPDGGRLTFYGLPNIAWAGLLGPARGDEQAGSHAVLAVLD